MQKAPEKEFGRVALDLPLEVEISQAEFFWAPEVAGVRWICGWKWVFAAEQRSLVKGKVGRGRLLKEALRSERESAFEGERVGEESIYRGR